MCNRQALNRRCGGIVAYLLTISCATNGQSYWTEPDAVRSPDVTDVPSVAADVGYGAVETVDESASNTRAASTLLGAWVNQYVGDCADLEERLTFEPLGVFSYRVVDDNKCIGPINTDVTGEWSIVSPGVVHFGGIGTEGGTARTYWRTVSFAVLPVESDTPALHASALHREGNEYRRIDHRIDEREGHISNVRLESSVRLTVGEGPGLCRMDIRLSARTRYSQATSYSGDRSFTLECTIEPVLQADGTADGWLQIAYPGDWGNYWQQFQHEGLPVSISQSMRAYFIPAFRYLPSAAGGLPEFLLGAGQTWFRDTSG